MGETGFFYDELTDFQKDMMDLALKGFPKETDKFLRQEGRKLTALQKRIARQDVGTTKGIKKGWKKATSYMAGFRTSKIFIRDDIKKVSAHNKAPHAHLVEYGHMQIPRSEKRATTKEGRKAQYKKRKAAKDTKYTHGKYVITASYNEFKHQFASDCEKFTDDVFSGNFK